MNDKKTNMIKMPDSVRERISIPVREMGSAATRVVVSHDSNRAEERTSDTDAKEV